MTKRDWIEVGLKLLGVYFAVTAIATVIGTLVYVFYELEQFGVQLAYFDSGGAAYRLLHLLRPIVFAIAACVLLCRTEWCLRKLGCPPGTDDE